MKKPSKPIVIVSILSAVVSAVAACMATFYALQWAFDSPDESVYFEVSGILDGVALYSDNERVEFFLEDEQHFVLKAPDFIQYMKDNNQQSFWEAERGKLIELTIRRDGADYHLDSFVLKPPPVDITEFTREELARAKRDQENAIGRAAEAARKACAEQGIEPDSPEGEQFILNRVDEAIQAYPYPPR
jgi:hypothetical protein